MILLNRVPGVTLSPYTLTHTCRTRKSPSNDPSPFSSYLATESKPKNRKKNKETLSINILLPIRVTVYYYQTNLYPAAPRAAIQNPYKTPCTYFVPDHVANPEIIVDSELAINALKTLSLPLSPTEERYSKTIKVNATVLSESL